MGRSRPSSCRDLFAQSVADFLGRSVMDCGRVVDDAMTPTNKLRWLTRNIPTSIPDEAGRYGTEMVLQQWWENDEELPVDPYIRAMQRRIDGEWRDVPIKEEK